MRLGTLSSSSALLCSPPARRVLSGTTGRSTPDGPTAEAESAVSNGNPVPGQHDFDDALPHTNGRSCATCHVAADGFSLTPAHVAAVYAQNPHDPLFNPIDADDPGAAVPTYDHLKAGLVRVTLTLADNLDVVDASGNVITNAQRTISVWRGVPSTENVAYTAPYQYDGRAPTPSEVQAVGALDLHSQIVASRPPPRRSRTSRPSRRPSSPTAPPRRWRTPSWPGRRRRPSTCTRRRDPTRPPGRRSSSASARSATARPRPTRSSTRLSARTSSRCSTRTAPSPSPGSCRSASGSRRPSAPTSGRRTRAPSAPRPSPCSASSASCPTRRASRSRSTASASTRTRPARRSSSTCPRRFPASARPSCPSRSRSTRAARSPAAIPTTGKASTSRSSAASREDGALFPRRERAGSPLAARRVQPLPPARRPGAGPAGPAPRGARPPPRDALPHAEDPAPRLPPAPVSAAGAVRVASPSRFFIEPAGRASRV